MNYELAKKLKEAGFPQGDNPEQQKLREDNDPYEPNNRTMWVKYFTKEYVDAAKDKIVYIPTLSELIEACGSTVDNTEETFARLWFALNHKP